jgi:hypothetical protein
MTWAHVCKCATVNFGFACLLILPSCRRAAPPGEKPDAMSTPDSSSGQVTDTAAIALSVPVIPDQTTLGGDSTPIQPGPRVRELSLRDVLGSDAYVGQTVRVTGRCLGLHAGGAAGPPPVTKSDWILEGDGVHVYVTGALPPDCRLPEGAREVGTFVVRVEQDTLRSLGGQDPATRQYLVRVR